MENSDLYSRVRAVYKILKSIGSLTVHHEPGPKVISLAQSTESGVTLRGKFWYYHPSYDFKVPATFLLELSVIVQPEATGPAPAEALSKACTFLMECRSRTPTFTPDETQTVVGFINSGDLFD